MPTFSILLHFFIIGILWAKDGVVLGVLLLALRHLGFGGLLFDCGVEVLDSAQEGNELSLLVGVDLLRAGLEQHKCLPSTL